MPVGSVAGQEGELTTAPAPSAARLSSLAGFAGAAALAAALALVLASRPPSALLIAGGAAGLAAVLALAVTRYELAVAAGSCCSPSCASSRRPPTRCWRC